MALVPIVGPAVVRKITTFDLEWVPPEDIPRPVKGEIWDRPRYSEPLPLRVVGVYDERGFRHYLTIKEFLENELTQANKGRWFYAHAGGLADMAFVFDEIIRHIEEAGMVVYKVRACFSGSAAIIVRVSKGKNLNWTFIDSFWLMRVKLADIAKDLHKRDCDVLRGKEDCSCGGLKKLDEEKRKTKAETKKYFRDTPMDKLLPYNRQDCEILHEAISQFQDTVRKIGGQLQMTIASTGLNLFRRRFLREKIITSEFYNTIVEDSYFASRVEVFNKVGKNFFIYDINSSFPYAMTFHCPGQFIGERTTIPRDGEHEAIYFADVEIEVPDMYLPPIPYRVGQRLFFPTGRWRSWLSRIDIELLEKKGGKIHKVHNILHYAPCDYMKAYAETIYEMRRTTKVKFEKTVYKFLLNSLYGKMAEGLIKSTVMIHPEVIDRELMERLMPGVWQQDKEAKVAHRHVAMSSWITAIARRTLYGHLDMALGQDCPIYYCDTDSVATPAVLPSDPDKLGSLKLEKKMNWGTFAAPKVYQGEGYELQKDGSWSKVPMFLNKAKGFSLPDDKAEAIKQLSEIIEGREIYVQRMARLRELWRNRGDSTPVEVLIRKAFTGKNVTKRKHNDDGTTWPWSVAELEKMAKKRKDGMV